MFDHTLAKGAYPLFECTLVVQNFLIGIVDLNRLLSQLRNTANELEYARKRKIIEGV